jgi:hypothetical protein
VYALHLAVYALQIAGCTREEMAAEEVTDPS